MIERAQVESLIRMALEEDIGQGDITSRAIFGMDDSSSASIIAKQQGVLCGTDIVRFVYEVLDPRVRVTVEEKDGSVMAPGEEIIIIEGPTASILSGERTALNFIQRMSGISTKTAEICALLEGTGIALLDTRKTVPGFRVLDKYAVKTGGGRNHRMGLFDMIMIKDNHIKAAGGIKKAVEMVRKKYGSRYIVEVETSSMEEVADALSSGADIIMLDNMEIEMVGRAVELIHKKAKVEISGNVEQERIIGIRHLAVDYISMGALTHSVRAFDFSMTFRK